MNPAVIFWISDTLVILGLVILSLAIYGMFWLPDIYTRLHAASKAAFLGVIPLLIASSLTSDSAFISRSILIGIFLLLTTPVSAHVIAHAAYLKRETLKTPGAVDESEQILHKVDNQRKRSTAKL